MKRPSKKRYLLNLAQRIPRDRMEYMSREQAYENLKRETLQDFGYDVKAWEQWFEGKSLFEAMPGILIRNPEIFEEGRRRAYFIKSLEDSLLIDALREFPKHTALEHVWRIIKDEALNELKRRTGQDFGYDADAWQKWLDENERKPDNPEIEENEPDE